MPVYATTALHPLLNAYTWPCLGWTSGWSHGSQDTGLDLDIDAVCGPGQNLDVVILWDPDVGPEMELGH